VSVFLFFNIQDAEDRFDPAEGRIKSCLSLCRIGIVAYARETPMTRRTSIQVGGGSFDSRGIHLHRCVSCGHTYSSPGSDCRGGCTNVCPTCSGQATRERWTCWGCDESLPWYVTPTADGLCRCCNSIMEEAS
jgi:hypothetical protein